MSGMPAPARKAKRISPSRSSPPLCRLGRVARQRLVYEALTDELATRVHALSLTTLIPEEDRS